MDENCQEFLSLCFTSVERYVIIVVYKRIYAIDLRDLFYDKAIRY